MTRFIAIDFGTTATAAATLVEPGEPELVRFRYRARSIPSAVFCRDGGRPLVGREAAAEIAGQPQWGERTPKAHVRDGAETLHLGGPESPDLPLSKVVAWLLESVYERALGDSDPAEARVALTCPQAWAVDGPSQRALRSSAVLAGLPDPKVISEPEAAAHHIGEGLDDGSVIAVYDMGGGTCDVALLELRDGELQTLAHSGEEGAEHLIGGESFDYAVFEDVLGELESERPEAAQRFWAIYDEPAAEEDPEWRAGYVALWNELRRAREELSSKLATTIELPPPAGGSVAFSRERLEALINGQVEETKALVEGCVERAGRDPDAVYLVGGTCATPLVRRAVEEAAGVKPVVADQPKGAVALGAVRWLSGRSRLAMRGARPHLTIPRRLEVIARLELEATVEALAWSSAGDQLATVTGTGRCSMLALPSMEELWRSEGRGRGGVTELLSVAITPDGLWVAAGGGDGQTELRGVTDGAYGRQLPGDSPFVPDPLSVTALRFNADGSALATGRKRGEVKVWHTEPRLRQTLWGSRRPSGAVRELAYAPDHPDFLFSGSDGGDLQAWHVGSSEPLWSVKCDEPVWGLEVTPDGSEILVASGPAVQVHDSRAGGHVRELGKHDARIFATSLSADGALLASGAMDGTLKLWDVEEGKCLRTFEHDGPCGTLEFAPSGYRLAYVARLEPPELRLLSLPEKS